MRWKLTFLLIGYISPSLAQDTAKVSSPRTFSGYVEVYYQYDFNRPANHTRPPFVYSYNRTNEVAMNLGYVKASYTTQKVRADVALMTGTYANANLVNEPGVLKNLFEANAGLKLSKRRTFWIDAGVLPSHIGFESAIGKDCWTLTRSILADNSPYYESGIRTSYKAENNSWYFAVLLLNGWQRMQRVDGNNTPGFGTQISLTPTVHVTVNSSTFIGSVYPDSVRRWRYFHDFYTVWQLSKHLGLTVGFDAGMEQRYKGSHLMNPWYAAVLLLRYAPWESWYLTARWEYYRDTFGVIVPKVDGTPFEVQGGSLNVDHLVTRNLLWRLEGRMLWSKHPYFVYNTIARRTSATVTTCFCVSLN